MKIRFGLLLLGTCLVTAPAEQRVEEEEIAVFAKVFNDYTREPSAVGGYKAETFAFANGGAVAGSLRDDSVDQASFNQIIQLISPALTRQNYVAATDPQDTDLLIYVNWGATSGLRGASELNDGTAQAAANLEADWYGNASVMDEANRRRDRSNFSNAALLGYSEAMAQHIDLRAYGVHGTIYQDLVADVEEPRYFVILTAFDFKTAWASKQLVPLWSIRYNIAAQGNHFTAALPSMSLFASRFFGRESGGLIRRLNPTGKVEMGDVQILGETAVPDREQ
jgi:hypothetical protein